MSSRLQLRTPLECRALRRVAAVVFLALLVGACANPPRTRVVWERSGGGDVPLETARSECAAISESVETRAVHRDRVAADSMGRAFVECMRERGWTWRTEEIPD